MTSLPETKYAKSGDVSIAYQVTGKGPRDLVVLPGIISNVDFWHEMPGYTPFIEQLASFARVITLDKRGSGMSDRVSGAPSLEVRMDDVRAVMDAAGSERAVLLGVSEGGPMSALFAATYPERVTALVLYGSFARATPAPGYPGGLSPAVVETLGPASQLWGRGSGALAIFAPSVAADAEWQALWPKLERFSASPGAFAALTEMISQIDVRPILPTIRVPTLVLHRRGDRVCPVESARRMAEAIPDAGLVVLEGEDHVWFVGDVDALTAEIEEFLTGQRKAMVGSDRVLATVLFTDIVGSTIRVAEVGDRRWHQLLDSHDEIVRRQLERFRGRLIKSTGDGVLATFDGPARGIGCASAIRDGVQALGMQTKAGLHTGEIELRGDDVGGIAVHIAARVLEKAGPDEVLVSRTLTDLVAGSDLRFEDRGEHTLQGVAEKWRLFSVAA